MKKLGRWILWLGLLALFAAGVAYSLWPQPVEVEVMAVSRGEMQVTINEDGITRVRERYLVSSPVAGQLLRIELRSGDPLKAGGTLLATIRPSDPSLLDARQIAETKARASAAHAAIERAEARRSQAKVASDLAETQLGRARNLREKNSISQDQFDSAEAAYRSRQQELRAAMFESEIAQFEYQQAQAALGITASAGSATPQDFKILSPIDGVVLRILQESATVVQPGSGLIELGDPSDLEIVIDVLSSDAVKIQRGHEVRLEHWGGSQPLTGKVRVVEPAAFTKISALGVEEQRVNVIADFPDPYPPSAGLGDGYRVEAEIVIWNEANVLQVPTAALFRIDAEWKVFVVVGDRVEEREVKIGQRNESQAQVLSGLNPQEQVVIYPSDLIREGIQVQTTLVANPNQN